MGPSYPMEFESLSAALIIPEQHNPQFISAKLSRSGLLTPLPYFGFVVSRFVFRESEPEHPLAPAGTPKRKSLACRAIRCCQLSEPSTNYYKHVY